VKKSFCNSGRKIYRTIQISAQTWVAEKFPGALPQKTNHKTGAKYA
jgi:hypothetical protein